MPYVTLPGGVRMHVRMAKQRRRRCTGAQGCPRVATHQCDYQVAAGKTCDAWICGAHATSVGPDVDHCPTHACAEQHGLFTGLLP